MNTLRFARARHALALLLTVIGLFWMAPAAAQQDFFTVTPCRVYDSRGNGGPLNQGTTYTVPVAGLCGIPATATAVSINVTVIGATGSGELVFFPAGGSPPSVAVLPFTAGRTVAMFSLVPLGTGGALSALATMTPPSPGFYQLVLDVTGYFIPGPPVAVNDSYATEKDTPLNVNAATGVTSNDTLVGGAIVSYGATTGAEQTTIGSATPTSAGGTVSLNADGSFSYTPPPGAVSIDDTFKYILQNPSGTSTATVTIGVGKLSQTITFDSTAPTDAKVSGPTYTVAATATSGLPVTFTIDASAASVCSIAGSTVSFIGAGTCVINANQAGDASYNPAPQVQQSFPVAKGDQTITFTSTAPTDATVGGATYTVTATATSGLAVTFTIDASASTVCSIAGSTVSFIGNGTCVINADQAGDANWNPAPQVQQSFTVKTAQTISFTSTAPSDASVGGPTYTVTATATSGLPVTFTIDASASTVCSIAGSTVSFIGNGTCVINADQAGDANYYPAPQVQQSFGVKTSQTISFTSTAPTDATVGGPTYTVTATATSGLPVTFTIDASASTVCTIAGSTVSFIGNGTCVINANQAGDATYHPAPQVQQSFTVKTAQTISFTSTAPTDATVGGPTYTVTATATSGLPVTFTIDASASTVCTIAGSTVSFIGNGTCVINANQAGDANYYPAPQVQQSFAVKTSQTISFTSTAPTDATVGGPTYTVTATATSGLPVTFTIDASASTVCTIAGSTVSFIGNGTCVINANQAGDATYHPAPQVQQSFTVKTAQTISFTSTPPATPTVGGPTYTVTATATSGLPVTFTIDASASTVCSIAGSTVSFIGNGTCVINANQAGDANYYPAPQVQQSFAVKSAQTISFTSTPPSPALVAGPTYTVTATATSSLPVTFTIDASASTVCTIAGSTVSFIGAGTCVINANQAGDANYYPAPQVQQSFQVVKQDQTITFTSTPPALATIGGPTYTVTATATSGLPVTFTIDASAASVCTIAGSTVSFIGGGTCVINANQAGNTTYNPAPQVQQSFAVNFPPQLKTPPGFPGFPKETFDTIGNTAFEFKAAQSLSPGVFVAGNLEDNFTDGDGPSPLSVNAIVDGPTTNGGQVDVGTNGEFTYTPRAGDTAAFDEFSYQVTDGAYTINRTVRINLRSRVWYVKNDDPLSAPISDDGTSVDPFNTLNAAQTASLANDYIFVYYGDGASTNQAAGIVLKNGQHLIGQFAGLTVTFNPAITFNGVAGTTSVTLLTQPSPTFCSGNPCRPLIDHSGAGNNAVSANDAIPVEIVGLSLQSTNANAIDLTNALGMGTATLSIQNNVLRGAGAEGLDINLNAGTTGTLTLNVTGNSWNTAGTHTGNAVDINRAAGTLNLSFSNNTNLVSANAAGAAVNIVGGAAASTTITGFANNTIHQNAQGAGIAVSNVTFDASSSAGVQPVSGGTTQIGQSGDGVTGGGLSLSNVAGALAFTDLDIFSGGIALSATGAGGFDLDVSSGAGQLVSTGGAALSLATLDADIQNVLLTSTTSTSGVSLTTVSGTVSASPSSSITKSSGGGTAFSVASSSATVNYGGTLNVTSGSGVSLTSNTGATNFSGNLTLSTGGSPAFSATGGGSVTATDTSSTLTTTTGTPLTVTGTNIGSAGLRFQSITSNGAVNGVVLNATTGSTGRLVVGPAVGGPCNSVATCAGGAIQNSSGAAISLTNTRNASFTEMYILNGGTHGVSGTGMTDVTGGANPTFELKNSFLESPGDGDNESALYFDTVGATNITGRLVVSDTTIQNFEDVGVHVGNNSGTLTIDLTNLTINNNSDTNGEEGVDVAAEGTANITLNVSGASTFTDLEGGGFNVITQNSGVVDMNITGTTITGTGGPDNFPTPPAMTFSAEGGASTMTFDITNNDILDSSGDGIFIGHEGTIMGRITGNDVSGMATGDALRIDTDTTGSNTVTILVDGNNFGNVAGFTGIGDDGIQVLHRDGTKVLNLTITNNQIANTASEGIRYFADDDVAGGGPGNVLRISGNTFSNIGDPNTIVVIAQDPGTDVCTNITGNTLTGAGVPGITLQQSLSAVLQITQASTAALATANEGATVTPVGTITFNGTCVTPPQPTN